MHSSEGNSPGAVTDFYNGNIPCGANTWGSLVLAAVHIIASTLIYCRMTALLLEIGTNVSTQTDCSVKKAVREAGWAEGAVVTAHQLCSQLLTLLIRASVRFIS